MKRRFLRGAALALAATTMFVFSACGKSESEDVVATVNGQDVTVGEYQYYMLSTAYTKLSQLDSNFNGDVSNIDWNQTLEDGRNLTDAVHEDALQEAVNNVVLMQKAVETGFSWDESKDNEINTQVDSAVSQNGEQSFLLNAKAMGIDSIDNYKKLYKQMTMTSEIKQDITDNKGQYITDEESLKQYKGKNGATVLHVLILNDSEKYPDPKATAQEVCDKAKAGEDFAALVTEYNEDPGEDENGYTFGPGEMVPEFEKAAFALDVGAVSDVVESSYGYHVIKRFAGAFELIDKWASESTIEKNENNMKKVDLKELLTNVTEAQKKVQASAPKATPASAPVSTAVPSANTASDAG